MLIKRDGSKQIANGEICQLELKQDLPLICEVLSHLQQKFISAYKLKNKVLSMCIYF